MLSIVRRIYLIILICWTLVIYSGMVTMLCSGSMFARKINNTVLLTDFVNHYNASLLSRTCLTNKIDIYDPEVQAASEQKIIDPIKPDLPFYLQYPPYFFALTLPLSFVNITAAYCIWSFVGLGGLLFCVHYLLKQVSFDNESKLVALFSVLMAYPTWLSFGMGQTSLFNFTAIILSFFLLQKRRALLAGLFASLVSIKLQYAPLIGLFGLMLGKAKYVLGFAMGFSVLVLYAVLVLGIKNVLAFPQALLMFETSKHVSGVSPITMQNIRGYLTLIAHEQHTHVVTAISGIVYLISLGAVAWLCRRYTTVMTSKSSAAQPESAGDDNFKMLVSLIIPMLLVGSLHAHVYDYVMTSVSCIWMWDLTGKREKSAASTAIRALILLFPIASWFAAKFREPLNALYIQADTLWAIAFLTLCLRFYFFHWRGPAQGQVDADGMQEDT